MNLKDKIVLVTGASSGIGQGIAICCAKQGANVLITYRNNEAGARATLEEIQTYSSGQIFRADLTRQEDRDRLFQDIKEKVGGIDALVNNAGQYKSGDVLDDDIWKDQMKNILFAAVHTTQKFLKQNESADLRKIVNITSIWGKLHPGNDRCIAYAAAKAALASMTVSLAHRDPKVQVNAVAPGYTESAAWETASEDYKKTRAEKTIIKRFVTPEEIGKMVVALLENDAMTGQVITVDGGFSLYPHPADEVKR